MAVKDGQGLEPDLEAYVGLGQTVWISSWHDKKKWKNKYDFKGKKKYEFKDINSKSTRRKFFFPKMGQTTESMISFQCVMKYKEDVEKKWEKQILLQTEKYANTRYNT